MRDRSLPPFWQTYARNSDRLRSSVEAFVETVEKANRYRKKNLLALRKCEGAQDLLDDISRCSDARPCKQILCPICARLYRIWFAANALRWFSRAEKRCLSTKILVVRLRQASDRDLPQILIARLHDRLRKRLRRAGISRVIGGTEASYNKLDGTWTVHFHLLVFDADPIAIAAFASKCAKDGINRAVSKPQELNDPIEQIAYLQKFSTFYRAGAFNSRGKGRAIRMEPAQIAALASWTGPYEFEDFLFLAGFRRYADRIVRTAISAAPQLQRVEKPSPGEPAIATTWRRGDALSARTRRTCRRPVFNLLSALGNSVVYHWNHARDG